MRIQQPFGDPHLDKQTHQPVCPEATVERCRTAWADIDNYAFNHLHPPERAPAKQLRATEVATAEAGLPRASVSPMFGKFLSVQARLVKAKHILEIGTLGGYSAIWMAHGVPGVHVTTIEYKPENAELARRNIANAGVEDRVTVLVGAALDVLPGLLKDVAAGRRERFGMTFIDADKMNSYRYCQYAAKMSVSGACVIVDNCMGKHGARVDDPTATDEHAVAGRNVIESIGQDPKIDGVIMQFVGQRAYDGFFFGIVD